MGDERFARFEARRGRIAAWSTALETTPLVPTAKVAARARDVLGIALAEPTTPARLLRRSDVTAEGIERFLEHEPGVEVPPGLTARERRTVANRLRYGGYIERQERDRERLRREEGRRIPAGFDFAAVGGLSREVREKLERVRPETLAEAARLSGVTPAAITLLNVALERRAHERRTE